MVWNAASTFEASSADVSMNVKPFAALRHIIICTMIPQFESSFGIHTCKCLCLICWHSSQVLQIAFVTDEHDNDIRIGVISELLQPPRHVDVGSMFRDVIDEECSDRSAIVCRGNGAITFLTGWRAGDPLDGSSKGVTEDSNAPVSQICALTVLPSMANERVANSTPIVDFDSRLNSLRVNRERTACYPERGGVGKRHPFSSPCMET